MKETSKQKPIMFVLSKKLQAAALSVALALQSLPLGSALSAHASSPETKNFIVTAYYSPLPGQSYYLRGSYEADIRLNGNGTHGASGKPVYVGMLAAPKHYQFGTVIHLEGLGTGTVDDRGGAIVKAGERGQEHDRIDVWMGEGEAGLRRALSWGKRTVRGTVFPDAPAESVSLKLASVPKVSLAAFVTKTVEERVFSEPIGPNSSTEMIRALSEKLSVSGYLPAGTRDRFDAEMKFALIRFQSDRGLIKGPSDSNAGYYGPSTRKALKVVYESEMENRRAVSSELEGLSEALVGKVESAKSEVERVRKALEAVGTPKENETGSHVRTLQEALGTLGYLSAKPTGIFGPKTKEALADFQIEKGLVSSKSDPNAGKFGKLTKSRLLISLLEKDAR